MRFEDHFLEEGSPSSNPLIDPVSFSRNSLIFSLYIKICDFDRHFETISTRYKNISLSWLLATYAAVGVILSHEILPLDHFLAIGIISSLGFIGVTLIWHLDMNVYHKFWAILFAEEIKMEKKYPFLLQSKKIAYLIDESKERIFFQGIIYLVSNTILLITTCISLLFYFEHIGSKIAIFLTCSSLICLILILMINNSKKLHSIINKTSQKN